MGLPGGPEMKTVITVLAVVLTAAPKLAGQEDRTPRISLEARLGYTRPAGDLGRADSFIGGYVAFKEVEAGPSLGGGLSVRLGGPFVARVRADHATETTVGGQWFCDAFTPCPAVLILVDGRVRSWSLGAEIHYRPRPSGWPFEPTVFVGSGRRTRRIRWDSPVPEVPIPTSYDQTDTFLRAGFGGSRTLGPASLFVEVETLLDSFGRDLPLFVEGVVPPDELGDPDTLMELQVSLGVRIGIH